jgi:hypothetical protein
MSEKRGIGLGHVVDGGPEGKGATPYIGEGEVEAAAA